MQRILLCLMLFGCFALAVSADQGVEVVLPLGGALHGVVIDGDEALIAEGSTLMRVPLIGTEAYQAVERLPLTDTILDVQRDTNGVFALTETGVYSLSPDGRAILDFLPGSGVHLAVGENYLAVAAQAAGIRIIQRLPDGKLDAGILIDTPGSALQVAVHPQWIAVADQIGGLRLYDPTTGVLLSAITTITPAERVESGGSRLYVSSHSQISMIDVSYPNTLRILGHYAPAQNPQRSIMVGEWLILADASAGVKVYQAQTAAYQTGEVNRASAGVLAVNNWLISAAQDGVHLYDVNRLPALVEIQHVLMPAPPTALALDQANQQIIIALADRGLHLRRLGDFADLGILSMQGTVIDMLLSGQLAYLLMDDGRLLTVDLPSRTILAAMEISGAPQGMISNGQTAVIASGAAGFYVIELSQQPHQIRRIAAEFFANAVTYNGRWLLQDGDQLRVFDGNWQEVTRAAAPGGTLTSDTNLIIAAGDQRLAVLSADLRPIAAYTAPAPLTDMQALTGQLVISSQNPKAAFVRLDMNDPTQPHELENRALAAGISHFYLRGDDLLAITSTGIFEHIRLTHSLLAAGRYTPLAEIKGLLADENRLLAVGAYPAWISAEGSREIINVPGIKQAARWQDQLALLHDNGTVTLYRDASIHAFTEINATAITAGATGWWAALADGQIVRLEGTQVIPVSHTQERFKALLWANNFLYSGSEKGEIWRWENGVPAQIISLGKPIEMLTRLPDGTLAAAAGDITLLDANLTLLQTIPINGDANAVTSEGNLIAVGSSCGAEIYQNGQRIGQYTQGAVQAIAFFADRLWVAGSEGVTALRISPGSVQLPQPYAPQPNDQAVLASPVRRLSWLPAPSTCETYRYEVSINGQLAATLNHPIYEPSAPLDRSTRWQVTLISADGQRMSSPEWRFSLDAVGWLSAPQTFESVTITRAEQQAKTRTSILLGIVVVIAGMIGLGWLWQRTAQVKRTKF